MRNQEHLVVVRTSKIPDRSDKPSDAVIHADYWHIGDQDRINLYFENIEELVANFVKDRNWQLVQWICFNEPFENELIFSCNKDDFSGIDVSFKNKL